MRKILPGFFLLLGLVPRPASAQRYDVDPDKVYKVPVDSSPVRGAKAALVTIVEFSDFQCPFCARAETTLVALRAQYKGKLRVAYKHMPLPFHPQAMLAAEASFAADAQGKFWPMHDWMMQNQQNLGREALLQQARALGLKETPFREALDSGLFRPRILADIALGESLGASGTPTFFINGRPLRGAQPIENFERLINEELKKAEALIGRGVALKDVYAELTKNGAVKGELVPARAPSGDVPRGPDPSKVHPVPIGSSPARGKKDAPITIVEFSDFECPFCGRVQPTLERVRQEYGDNVRIVYKHNPLSFHAHADLAAQAAAAAGAQGKFWEYHDLLFANPSALERADLERLAATLKLNLARFRKALDAKTYAGVLRADAALANALGANGTPAFFINGRYLSGAQPFERFKILIDEELERAEEALREGAPKDNPYPTLVGTVFEGAELLGPPAQESKALHQTIDALTACREQDLGTAVATYKDLKGPARQNVRRDCLALGVALPK